jgi:predicted dithiol-disulfide oxidoreductase (DUF899 family)
VTVTNMPLEQIEGRKKEMGWDTPVYSSRGTTFSDDYNIADITAYGRKEDWEDSPEGWPQEPTYG